MGRKHLVLGTAGVLLLTILSPNLSYAQTQNLKGGRLVFRRIRTSRFQQIGYYIRTHKLPLIADTLDVLASAADAESTLHAERVCPTCSDQGFWPHPATAQIYLETMIGPALGITMNHLAYHHYAHSMPDGAPDKAGQCFFIALFTGPIVVHGYADVRDNVEVGPPHGSNLARARLTRARPTWTRSVPAYAESVPGGRFVVPTNPFLSGPGQPGPRSRHTLRLHGGSG